MWCFFFFFWHVEFLIKLILILRWLLRQWLLHLIDANTKELLPNFLEIFPQLVLLLVNSIRLLLPSFLGLAFHFPTYVHWERLATLFPLKQGIFATDVCFTIIRLVKALYGSIKFIYCPYSYCGAVIFVLLLVFLFETPILVKLFNLEDLNELLKLYFERLSRVAQVMDNFVHKNITLTCWILKRTFPWFLTIQRIFALFLR